MVKLDVKYSVVLDGENVVLEGIQNLPTEIEKDLVERGFAKKLLKEDVAPKDLGKAKTIFLVDGKLTEKEPVAEGLKEIIYTRESIVDLKVAELEALAKEKGIELKGKDKAEKLEEICLALGL